MSDNTNIRNEAWGLLWARGWFWRLLGGSILLAICTQIIVSLVNQIVFVLGVFNITALMSRLQQHQGLPELSAQLIWEFASSFVLYLFFSLIMGAIAAYGIAVITLRAADDDDRGWLKAAFGGFKMPLGLGWLSFRIGLVYLFWAIIAVIPVAAMSFIIYEYAPPPSGVSDGIIYGLLFALAVTVSAAVMCIPFYRYRYLFRIKADHPDYSAGECLELCLAITDENKWKIFMHDCSYWRIMLLILIPLTITMASASGMFVVGASIRQAGEATLLSAILALVGVSVFILSYFALIVLGVITAHYIGVGQTILYRKLAKDVTARRDASSLPND